MRLRPEPTVATWFLKLFCSSPEHESLIGDLLEQYQRGRGRFWYWRQVIAIVFLGLERKVRRLLVSTDGIRIRQGFALILLISAFSAVLLSDIWQLSEAAYFLGSPHVFRWMDDDFLQVQDGGGVIKVFGVALIDHGLKDGDLLWFQEALLQCGLPA